MDFSFSDTVEVGRARPEANHTILVVDDDPAVLRVAAKVLRRSGYDVLEASGGEGALRLAAEREGCVDLLVTDIVMPQMGGRELSEAFRALYPHVSVLFMSGYTDDAVILQGIRLADVDFMGKPFSPAKLRDRVVEILSRSSTGGWQ